MVSGRVLVVQRSGSESTSALINNSYCLYRVLAKNSQRIVEHESQVSFQRSEKRSGPNVSLDQLFGPALPSDPLPSDLIPYYCLHIYSVMPLEGLHFITGKLYAIFL